MRRYLRKHPHSRAATASGARENQAVPTLTDHRGLVTSLWTGPRKTVKLLYFLRFIKILGNRRRLNNAGIQFRPRISITFKLPNKRVWWFDCFPDFLDYYPSMRMPQNHDEKVLFFTRMPAATASARATHFCK